MGVALGEDEQLALPLPRAVAAHYDDTVVLRIDPHGRNTSWDNRKVRI